METSITIDGWGPVPVVRPTTIGEVGHHVQQAASQQTAIYPVGGGSMLEVGLPPSTQGLALDLKALDAVIDYPARDMTITVQAGISMAKLQAILATEKQHLPVDIPFPELATLGGALATNANGPRRFGFGTLRDYVIGIGVVNDQGDEVHGGGRVVKNVAGYDMMKLFTGSFGTLGIITQVTLKVPPKPEASAVVLVACPKDQLAHAVNELLPTTKTRPVSVSVMNQVAALQGFNASPYVLAIGYEDQTVTVDWQIAQLRSELPTSWDITIHHHEAASNVFAHLRDLPYSGSFTFKATVLPAKVASFIQLTEQLLPNVRVVAHAGNGVVYGIVPNLINAEMVQPVLTKLLHAATEAGGNVILPRCPTAWKTVLPVWGRETGDVRVMRVIKAKLDPNGVFNPRRYVGGI